uniref:U40-Deinotoxin-Dsu1a_1 n=1 Tax=Deinopis subrufa TaxID=1905329 RepID=A0A4Q8KBJ3_DEISU
MKVATMIFFYVFIAASVLALSMGNDEYPLDPALRASIEEKLTKYDALEKTFKSIYAPEQLRDDENCLPVGAKCSYNSGPSCCGIRTRCNIWDTQLSANRPRGPARWISKCREYNLGVILDNIGNFFKSLG